MLLDFEQIYKTYNFHVTGVIHVGAHLGEEAPIYDQLGIKKVVWVEANPYVLPKLAAALEPYPNPVLHALITNVVGMKFPFRITNYDGMSSSIFEWGTHTQFSPDTIIEREIELMSTTLDDLATKHDLTGCNMLNIDIEGAGLLALEGAKNLLYQIDYLYLEVQTDNVYDGAPLLEEYDEFLGGSAGNFNRVETGIVEGQGWGDALYVRKK